MKLHITPKQAQELSEFEFYSLFDDVVPRGDWANYHHKKVTIGHLIGFLGERVESMLQGKDEWTVVLKNPVAHFTDKALVNSLWMATRSVVHDKEE